MKERIIGAIVLVVFVVLVVPIFLDGPPEEGEVISQQVLLPGQDGEDTKTVVLDRERSEPMPSVTTVAKDDKPTPVVVPKPVEEKPQPKPLVQTPAEQPRIEQEKPKTEPEREAASPPPTTPVASSTGMWAVQLGSFSNKQNAEKLAADLRKQGYAAFLSQLESGGKLLHRVRIGPQKDRDSAEQMAARLLKVNHKGQVVPHP
ncbi:MAG: SPOR domain-containing protein [Gammaproteobacteria bacterium]|nr:SPOR domain-containing protein [Gammaproteobacteria bacterium]